MTYEYDYSLSIDLNNSFNIEQLTGEIEADSDLQGKLYGFKRASDTVTIVFTVELTAGEKTSLDDIVTNHVPEAILSKGRKTYGENIERKITGTNIWKNISTFEIDVHDISNINIISRTINDSYTVRFYNVTDHNVISEISLTNKEIKVNKLTNITNMPYGSVVIDLQVKTTGTVILNSFKIYYS